MLFYLVLGGLFTLYALDLLLLVIVAFVARSAEVAALLRKNVAERRVKKKQAKASGKAEPASAAVVITAEADGDTAGSGSDPHAISIGRSGSEEPIDSAPSDDSPVAINTAAVANTRAVAVAGATPLSTHVLAGQYGRAYGGRLGPQFSAGTTASEVLSGEPSYVTDGVYDDEEYVGYDDDGTGGGRAAGAGGGVATAEIVPRGADLKDPYRGGPYPKVLVQLPMYNEEAHADSIITHCCAMTWPRERLLIQILDDSTKEAVRKKVDDAAAQALENGHPVQVLRRDNRAGFKAGAMVEGLNRVEGQGYEYCAIFDADFEPPHDFLLETISRLHTDRQLAYVQTRWAFANGNQSFLTWAQKVNLSFHFDVEQRARSFMGWFFNFNGTAGVWRIQAIHDAGGWQSDTVVEDMDLSLRCYLRGWRGLYLPHVDNPNEVPCTLSSYKTQQFRWLSGPMQILVKSFVNIWTARDISFAKRINCTWFFLRYVLFAAITLGVLAVPPVVLWVEPWAWHWPQIFFLVAINFALAVYIYITPFSIAYLLFSIAVGYFKLWAMLNGLIGGKKSKTWKVTQKYGAKDGKAGGLLRNFHRPYALELCLGLYYAGLAAVAAVLERQWIMTGYCGAMTLVFWFLAFGDMYL